jgi:lipopolysaccharide export system permease protein
MRLLDRYALREFTAPFFACVGGFTVMLLSGIIFDLTDLIITRKMPVETVLQLLVYKVPAVVVVTLPAGALFATLLSLGRFAKDSELTVMRGSGCSFSRLALPVVLAAVCISGVTFGLNEVLVPAANHRAQNLYRRAVLKDVLTHIDANVFLRGPEGRIVYVGEVNRAARRMRSIMIFEPTRPEEQTPFPVLITASTGTYDDSVWHLENGVRRTLDADGYVTQEAGFAALDIPMTSAEQLFGEQKTTDEMTRKELGAHIQLFRQSGLDVRSFVVDYHLKLALPLAAFIWVLVAAPLAVPSARAGRFYGVVVSIAVAFAYYVAVGLCRSLGGNGLLPPEAAAWLPNILFALLGLALLVRVEQA